MMDNIIAAVNMLKPVPPNWDLTNGTRIIKPKNP
jgi:hypothetical protein